MNRLHRTSHPFICTLTYVSLVLFVVFGVISLAPLNKNTVVAAANTTINFQARILTGSGSVVPDGTYNVEFKLFDAASSSGSSQGSCVGDANCLWTETYEDGAPDNRITTKNGYITTALGSVTAFPTTIPWGQQLYLSLNIGGIADTPVWDGEMDPRMLITAVPYAFSTQQLQVTQGSYNGTLNFDTLTDDRDILLPDEDGTVCLRNSVDCGFMVVGGGGEGDYIQNQYTSQQATSNFWISGVGRADTNLLSPILYGSDTANGTLTLQGNSAAAANTATNANLIFKVGNSGATTAMTILNNGNVGIGQGSPTYKLEVVGTLAVTDDSTFGDGTATDYTMNFNQGGLSEAVYYGVIFNNTKTDTDWAWQDASGTHMTLSKDGDLVLTGTLSANGVGNSYITGNLGIGDTSPAALLSVGSGDLFQVNSSGAIAAATGITSSGTISFSGQTIDLGTSNSVTTFSIGTGTAGNVFNIGTNNTTKDTINLGSALDDVLITGGGANSKIDFANFDVTTAGAVTMASTLTVQGASVTVGTASTTTGTIVLQNATNAYTVTISGSGKTDNSTVLTIPAAAGASDIICLEDQANCDVGLGGGANVSLSNLSSVDINAALNVTAGNLALQTTTSGNITLTPAVAGGLVNVLTGNLQVGNGTPDVSLDGEDVYIEGTLEVDGTSRFDSAMTVNSTLAVTGASLTVGTASTTTGTIVLQNAVNAYTVTFSGADKITNSTVLTVPTTAAASDIICLQGAANCLGGASGGANTALSNLTGVAINTSLLPGADDSIDLGSSSYRWRDLYLGPTSLHVVSLAGETTTARDWKLSVQETDGSSEGNLRVLEGSNELMNLTPTGNLGIGTTTPQTRLHVNQTAASSTAEEIARFSVSDDATAYLSLSNDTTSDSSFLPTIYALGSASSSASLVVKGDVSGVDTGTVPAITLQAQAGSAATTNRDILRVMNYTSEVLRIDQSGDVGVGTALPVGKLHVAAAMASGTGGTITYDSGYTVHTFTSSGTFTPSSDVDVEYLVVGGGGGGSSGGGGAGGLRQGYTTLSAGAITITVGTGGSGSSDVANTNGSNGTGSSIGAYVSVSGGGGGSEEGSNDESTSANTGGSGGGGAGHANWTTYGAAGTSGEGNAGGGNAGYYWNDEPAGGGGGAGSAGGTPPTSIEPANGGSGVSYSISGAATCYAPGGAGGARDSGGLFSSLGKGGCNDGYGNGGDADSNPVQGRDGRGGGGGGGNGYNSIPGADGGNGIIIIRYLTPQSDHLVVENSTGLVGIGTDSPTAGLDIQDGAVALDAGSYNAGSSNPQDVAMILKDYTAGIYFQSGTYARNLIMPNSGDIRIGQNSTTLVSSVSLNPGSSGRLYFSNLSTTATSDHLCLITATGQITYTNTADCGSSSSIRFKENVTTLDTNEALDVLGQLRPVFFDWKEEFDGLQAANGSKHDFGLIAEEVNEVLPEVVVWNSQGQIDGIAYEKFAPWLVAGIQQQQVQITGLDTNLTALTEAVSTMQGFINDLGDAELNDLTVEGTATIQNLQVEQVATINILYVTGPAEFGGDMRLTAHVNTQQAVTKKFYASKPIAAGSVVVLDDTKDGYVTTTDIEGYTKIVGVAIDEALAADDLIRIAIGGSVQVKVDEFTDVASGDMIVSANQDGLAEPTTNPTVGSLLGKATSGKDESNLIWVLVTTSLQW